MSALGGATCQSYTGNRYSEKRVQRFLQNFLPNTAPITVPVDAFPTALTISGVSKAQIQICDTNYINITNVDLTRLISIIWTTARVVEDNLIVKERLNLVLSNFTNNPNIVFKPLDIEEGINYTI